MLGAGSALAQGYEAYGGTPDYSSTNQLNCRTTGFHDDLESLGFAWLNMLTGDLPWDIMEALNHPSAPWSSGELTVVQAKGPVIHPHPQPPVSTLVARLMLLYVAEALGWAFQD